MRLPWSPNSPATGSWTISVGDRRCRVGGDGWRSGGVGHGSEAGEGQMDEDIGYGGACRP